MQDDEELKTDEAEKKTNEENEDHGFIKKKKKRMKIMVDSGNWWACMGSLEWSFLQCITLSYTHTYY